MVFLFCAYKLIKIVIKSWHEINKDDESYRIINWKSFSYIVCLTLIQNALTAGVYYD